MCGFALSACGAGSEQQSADRNDAKLAAQIRSKAAKYQAEAARRQKANQKADDAEQQTSTNPDGTMTVHDDQVGAGGSAVIDGADQSKDSGSNTSLFSPADRTSFERLARSLGGDSGVAASPLGLGQTVQALGGMRSTIAWSTSKVPVAMAVIAAGNASSQQSNLRQAITASDNAAAERLWSSLGSGTKAAAAANAQLRAAGDHRTHMQAARLRAGFTPFGQTLWRLEDQARFTAGMSCTGAGSQVLKLMGQVIAAHRWGLGAIGTNAQIKGGWGPGSSPGVAGGYQDRQMGIVTINGKPIAITIATRPSDGSHETGAAHLTTIAKWAVAHVDVAATPRRPRC